MSSVATYQKFRRFAVNAVCAFLVILTATATYADSRVENSTLDPRLEELVQIVKSRAAAPKFPNSEKSASKLRDEANLDLLGQLQAASYSRSTETILMAVIEFNKSYVADGSLSLSRITDLYTDYANGLERNITSTDLQLAAMDYIENGNWFERYIALEHSAYLHGTARERHAALQKAQLALSIIPQRAENDIYVRYAKSKITGTIADLHNLQGNSPLALSTSLDYLKLTKDAPDPEAELDLINNLIYGYGIGRNHQAQLFLSEHILDLEKTRSSSVPGLSEMRIANVMNSAGRFDEALEFATKAHSKTDNPIVIRNSQIYKAIALAGLGRHAEARNLAKTTDVNFTRKHILKDETRQGDLYLAFLLAQKEDPAYATQLFNRQLDVMAQKFLANNSRDTTALLAGLENSRERTAEREAATIREAKLQAITISRQKKLTQSLMVLSILLGLATVAAILFTRFRGRVLRKLEIKTREAASAEKLKTEFLGMISHELRTPLNGIIGISDYLANYHEDEDIRKKTSIILKGGNELLSVVESLTDMARIDAGQLILTRHDAELGTSLAAIPDNWTEAARAKGLKFTHYIDPTILRHHVDETRIIQCINILLANAISFTDSGRVHMHVTAPNTQRPELNVVVADTGQGMSELVQSRLFTPFMQADTSRKRSHMGTGLNLAIAYALVEMMGGKLSCISRDGRGSEFTFKVPLPGAQLNPQMNSLDEASEAVEETLADLPSLETPVLEEAVSVEGAEKVHPVLDRPVLESPVLENAVLNAPVIGASVLGFSVVDALVVDPNFLDAPVLETADAPHRDYVDLMMPTIAGPALHDTSRYDSYRYEYSLGDKEKAASDTPANGFASVAQQRILIVDDIDSNRDVLRLILESKGHVCGEAADGFAALAELDRKPYDLIILDIHMAPLDGIETLHRLRRGGKLYANIPVVALTADNDPKLNAETMNAGADLFLNKPIRREDILDAIAYLQTAETTRILSQRA